MELDIRSMGKIHNCGDVNMEQADLRRDGLSEDRSCCHINNVPEEILYKILSWLSVRDLCTAALVCRHWRNIGEDPGLWRHYLLEINYGTKLLPETLAFKRFSRLESLLVRGFDPYNEDQMRFDPSLVVRSRSIRRLELRLAYIDRNVTDFSSLIRCLSSLTLIFCLMTQVTTLWLEI